MTAGAILNVSAADKSTGKSMQINITNKMGRLSQVEFDRMVQVGVKFRTKDESNKTKIEAKNSYVVFCSHLVDRMVRRSWSSPWHQWLEWSIEYALGDGAESVVLCLHLGRPDVGEIEDFSMAPVAEVVHRVCSW